MQGILLVMCIIFRARQHKHGLDDFGRPLASSTAAQGEDSYTSSSASVRTPPPVLVEAALGDAVQSDVRSEHGVDVVEGESTAVSEETPLLAKQNGSQTGQRERGFLAWFRRR